MNPSSSVRSTAACAMGLTLLAVSSSFGQAPTRPDPGTKTPAPASLSPGNGREALRAEQFQAIKAIARAKGTVDVIVEFAVPNVDALTSRVYTATDHATAAAAEADLARGIGAVGQAEIGRLAGTQHRVNHTYVSIPFAALTVSPRALAVLEASPAIVGVNEDTLAAPLLDNTVNIIGAPAAWAEGFDGSGYYVAILDTGILASHQFFAGKNIKQACFARGELGLGNCPNGQTVDTSSADAARHHATQPKSDHGTHVTGIACGNDPSVPLYGVAPGADIIAIQVFSQIISENRVGSYSSDRIAAMEYLFSLRNTFKMASVNMSLGGGKFTSQSSCDNSNSAEKTAIDNLRAVGVATVIASGNDGFCPGLSAPGCISSAIAVGATTDSGVEASFSNYDSALLDVYAPGVSVFSSRAPSISGVTFGDASGTSMATPHVAGAFAVLKQGSFGEGVDGILQSLLTTGDPVAGLCVSNPSQRRINVINALQALAPIAQPCELTRLAPTPPIAGDEVGTSVALRGDVAVVGAALRGGDGTALVYRRSSAAWPEEQVLFASDAAADDAFGQAVGVEGDVVVVGAPGRGGVGAVYVYRWNGAVWQEVQILIASDAATGDEFGASVAIRGDVLAVGARARDCGAVIDCGAVYVYRFDGSGWTGEQRITASDASVNARFGFSVDANDTRVLVGSPNKGCGTFNNCGLAYSYDWNGSAWTGEVKLQGIGLGAGDWYGSSVALDGDYAMVGSPQDDLGAANAGTAYRFQRSGATWTQLNRFSPSDPLAAAQFGSSVALDVAGERLLVGAAFANAPGATGTGTVYVFRKNVTGWVELGKLNASGLGAGDQFGGAIALGGSFAIVSARLNDFDGANAGAAFVHAVSLDCNRTGLADACDIAGGAPDENGNGIPDECDCPPAAPAVAEQIMNTSGVTVPSVKSRFLSFSGGDAGLAQAVRVKFVSLPDVFNVFNGTKAWVTMPQQASESPGKALTDPVGADATFMAAKLSATPVYADWSTFGIVHVYDERIIPSRKQPGQPPPPLEPAIYDIQLVTEGCDLDSETSFSPALSITNARWGDMAALTSGQFRAPDGIVAVDDTLAILAKFGGQAGAPIKARAELLGVGGSGPVAAVDGKISVSDLLAVLGAFAGDSYPFPPPPAQ